MVGIRNTVKCADPRSPRLLSLLGFCVRETTITRRQILVYTFYISSLKTPASRGKQALAAIAFYSTASPRACVCLSEGTLLHSTVLLRP